MCSSTWFPEAIPLRSIKTNTILKALIKFFTLFEGLHLLLFAVHESVQESLGFSPFELKFGHALRGHIILLNEKWLDEDPEKISVLKYVATFKDRLFRAGQMAKRNLQESQSKMKVWYDRKAKSRCFEPGDR